MDLHERLAPKAPQGSRATVEIDDPFAELKNAVHLLVIGDLGPQLFNVSVDPDTLRERVLADIRRHLTQESGLSRDERDQITTELADDILGHGPLERLLADDTVSEIMVNGPHDIWIERQGRLLPTNVSFHDESHLRRILNKIVAQVGRRDRRVVARWSTRACPTAAGSTRSSRRSRSTGRSSRSGSSRATASTSTDMIRLGTLTTETIEFLERCVQAKLNILISGGTGTGKTTLLNVLSEAIPDTDRIITIEDSAELSLHQRHIAPARVPPAEHRGRGRGHDPRPRPQQPAHAPRPDRRRRGPRREALDMLQAMNTGHEGSLSTVHANSARDALSRIETMVMMAGFEIPLRAIRQQISVGARPDRADRAARGRPSPRHLDHRGAADGGRRDHAAGALRVQGRAAHRRAASWSAASSRPGCGRRSSSKFEKRGVPLPSGLFHEGVGSHLHGGYRRGQ